MENRIVQLRDAQPKVNVIIKAMIVAIFHFVGNWKKNNARRQKELKNFPMHLNKGKEIGKVVQSRLF